MSPPVHSLQLFTPAGELVTTLDIPRFAMMPDVIRWGVRTFVLRSGRYVEAFAYDAPL